MQLTVTLNEDQAAAVLLLATKKNITPQAVLVLFAQRVADNNVAERLARLRDAWGNLDPAVQTAVNSAIDEVM